MKNNQIRPGNLYRLCTSTLLPKIKAHIAQYKAVNGKYGSITHCSSVTAHAIFNLTDTQWNSNTGCEYYAATLAAIIHYNLY